MALSKQKKRNILIAIILLGAILLGLLVWLIVELTPFKGAKNYEYWLPTQTLKLEDTVVIQKDPNKDFVVLNLTDVQYNDAIDIGNGKKLTDKTIKEVVERVKPDLITVTGDNVWAAPFTRHSVNHFIELLDSFGIQWAPVFGNHDENGNNDLAWFADRLLEAKNCVFRRGPNNIGGLGNYIINVMEGEKIVHTLFMVDSGNTRYYPDLDKEEYDFIGAEKQAWYSWAVDGLTALNGGVKPLSSLFMHIALPEFKDAYDLYYDEKTKIYDESIGFGSNGEGVFSPPVNSGFFAVLKAKGSTKDVIVGHDHVNNSSILYQGIRLTYGMKTGDRCYWDPAKNGGTKLTIDGKGDTVTEHVYVTI